MGRIMGWAAERFEAWRNSLNGSEAKALGDYQREFRDANYEHVNGFLRKGEGSYPGEMGELVRERIREIDRAFEKAPDLGRPITVYRAFNPPGLYEAYEEGRLAPGYSFDEPGYSSTSLDPAVARRFEGVVGFVRLEPEDRALYLDLVEPLDEREMLLPRGGRFVYGEERLAPNGETMPMFEIFRE